MPRVVAQESLVIHIAWSEAEHAFEFRLLYGRKFITPKLWLSPLDWYALMSAKPVTLGEWVLLGRRGSQLEIRPQKELIYEGGSKDQMQWPSVSFAALYTVASVDRGVKPEEGWSEAYDRHIEEQRAEWEPA